MKPSDQELIRKIRIHAAGYPFIAALFLFGSRAVARERAQSDVDLAIVASEPLSSWQRVDLETGFSNALKKDVDIVFFGQASPLLQHQILRKGRLIYEKDRKERVRQETSARYAFLDTRHLHKEFRGC